MIYDYNQPYEDGVIHFDRVFTMLSTCEIITTTTDLLLTSYIFKRYGGELCALCSHSDSVMAFLADLDVDIKQISTKVDAIVELVRTSHSMLYHDEETSMCYITKNIVDLERFEVYHFEIQLYSLDTVGFMDLKVQPMLDFHESIHQLKPGMPFLNGILNNTSDYFDLKTSSLAK